MGCVCRVYYSELYFAFSATYPYFNLLLLNLIGGSSFIMDNVNGLRQDLFDTVKK